MAIHFLQSKAAKTLSLAHVFRMSEKEAETAFRKVRWREQATGQRPTKGQNNERSGVYFILAVDLARGLSRPLATHAKPVALGEDPAWG